MVHCHWEYDLRTSIQIAEAVEPIRPLWLEDPMPVEYTEGWRRLVASSKVSICTGENLSRRQGFKDFIINQGCDILHPDLRNTGGFPRDEADCRPGRGRSRCRWQRTTPAASSIRSPRRTGPARSVIFWHAETVLGHGDWMDDVVIHEDRVIKDGHIQPAERAGLGLELNPDVVKAHLAEGESYWDQDGRG